MLPAFRTRPLRLRLLSRALGTQAQYEHTRPDDSASYAPLRPALATPRQLVQYLNEYVIGQEKAKKVLSVAVYNHYNRVYANFAAEEAYRATVAGWAEYEYPPSKQAPVGVPSTRFYPHPQRAPPDPVQPRMPVPLFEKSNVLVIGPTGSGKTLLAKTLAKILDVPFTISDATSMTQAGYVGDDVDTCVQSLLQASDWDPYRASAGIICIDEIDKLARKGSGSDGNRDVSGEGVQQALLRMMEGSSVTVEARRTTPPVGGQGRSRRGQPPPPLPPDSYTIDTSNILFILSGAFVGLENIIKRRVAKGSIGFTANLASVSEGVGATNMPFFTPNTEPLSALSQVEPEDLVQYGFIPEFVSRMPSITTLAELSATDLRRVLTDVRGSLISQYTALFGYSGVEIRFTSMALDEICRKAAQRGGGARGLRGVMESLLMEPMYEAPGTDIRHVLIDHSVARGESSFRHWPESEGQLFWEAWAAEEAQYNANSTIAT